ncbi:MAG: isoprenylcysteine carboxylmethyltransferase family protein [Myxococcota bacterium]|nr:isoprenylcysteine carboxylmethyltransferase family protein [Myxococcota bacterium]
MITTGLSFYACLVLAVACQRIWELKKASRNTAALLAQGAREYGKGHYPVMAALHTVWLGACAFEAYVTNGMTTGTIVIGGLLLAIGQTLRLVAMRQLGERWTTRIIVLPSAGEPVTTGIFRYIRHPNYLGVILEIFALPLIGGAWVTAIAFSIANGLLLKVRIGAEEAALEEAHGYASEFEGTNRLIPGGPNP